MNSIKSNWLILTESLFLFLVFFLANIRSFIFWTLYPPVQNASDPAWAEIWLWLAAMLLMVFLLTRHGLMDGYLITWRTQPLMALFVAFALISILWSTSPAVTLQRSLVFAFASLAAAYLGTRYTIRQLLIILVAVGTVVLFASYLLIFLMPAMGTDLNPPYNGAWRGVFWHKNHLGNILPIFILVALVLFFMPETKKSLVVKTGTALLYVFSLVAVVFSRSASGYALVFLLHVAFGTALLWIKIKPRIQKYHYYLGLTLFVFLVIGILLNLEFIFGLLGRDVNLTGRVPMCGILFQEVVPLHPWLGQGFGTIWADADFRLLMRDRAGWPYMIMIGDNGFIDIVLNLGWIGLALFLVYYFSAWIHSARYSFFRTAVADFFPFIFMLYTLFANVAFSLFFETEVFIWMLMVTMVVLIKENDRH